MNTNKKLFILSKTEIALYFSCPTFNLNEQEYYFTLSHIEQNILRQFLTNTKWYFILQLGYFKARKQFFNINLVKAASDIDYITKYYQLPIPIKTVSEDTHLKTRNLILQLLEHDDSIHSITKALNEKAKHLTTKTLKPKSIFKELYQYIENSQCIMPQYSTFQKIISTAIISEEIRLQNIIKLNLSKASIKILQQLLKTQEQYYALTLLKRDQKNFRYAEIQKVIGQKNQYNHLYQNAKIIIPKLKITQNMIEYYASLINYYSTNKLKKLPEFTAYLYIICYIYHRMQKINDNLMSSFVYYVNKYKNAAKEYAKQSVYETKQKLNKNVSIKLPKALQILLNNDIPDEKVRMKIFKILPPDVIAEIIAYLTKKYINEYSYHWQYYDNIKHMFIKNLRPIFRCIDFTANGSCSDLYTAMNFLKAQFEKDCPISNIDPALFPITFIPSKVQPYIYELDDNNKVTNLQLAIYEFYVYEQILKNFKTNDITIKDSISYKSLIEDLIPEDKKESIIKDQLLLTTPFEKSLELDKIELDNLYYKVNQRIENNENKSVKIEQRNDKLHITLLYNKKEDLTNHDFFCSLPPITLIDILRFGNNATNFLNLFTHIKPHYSKIKKDDNFILGALQANGTHHGIDKMANISDLDYQPLFNAERNFIRLDTLIPAIDCFSEAIAKLPIFKDWNIQEKLLYAAIDGQKFNTRLDLLQARNSAKYFPLKKGISVYTLLANYIPLSAEILSPNLHESYFLFDIVKNMSADLTLDYISGDSHSINSVNFFLMRYLPPVEFAPHLVNINTKIQNLRSFDHPNKFKDLIIKPHKQAQPDLILQEENNMNWVVASLLYGEVKQSTIVRKLSSLSKHNKTCEAMSEYSRIYESIYTLNFIDRPELRQSVRGNLNRIEAYHQLRRAIILANGGEFRGNSEAELVIWNQCARLLINAIIFYNGSLLSAALKKYTALKDQAAVDIIKKISPLAWAHINMIGKLEFLVDMPNIDIDQIIADVDIF